MRYTLFLGAFFVFLGYAPGLKANNNFENIGLPSAKRLMTNFRRNHTTASAGLALFDISFFGYKILVQNKFSSSFQEPTSKLISPHGTSVAQVIGASQGGINPNAEFALFNVGTDIQSVRRGLRQARQQGVRLINISFTLKTKEIVAALNDFIDLGGIVVVSAGNGAIRFGRELPSQYKGFKGIVVSAMGEDSSLTDFSHYSPGCLLAPGKQNGFVVQQLDHRQFNKRKGEPQETDLHSGTVKLISSQFGQTSAAAPVITGLVSLALEIDPTLTQSVVEDLLLQTAGKNEKGLPVVNANMFLQTVIQLRFNK